MNEQIKLLAEKADNYAEQTVRYYSGQVNGLTWEVKIKQARDTKFAELIVRECAKKNMHNSTYNEMFKQNKDTPEMDLHNNVYSEVLKLFKDRWDMGIR
jgi:hypothetical protein